MITIDLSGKNALITGGTRGIGRAISRTLAQAGAATAAVYRTDEQTAEASLHERHAFDLATHHNYQADVADADQIARLVAQVQADFDGRLDILVHNAAAQGGGRIEDFPPDQWRRMLDVNLTAAYLLTRAMLPIMPRGASIVNIASGAGHDPMAGLAGYAASKAGLIMFTADLAQDIGPQGIRANVVSPGGTDTSPDPQQRPSDANALRRRGVAQDVANVVLFLCSDLASFVTGQALRVNGGAV
ncbi:MAG: SDR family oxidoreductase [Armatimonadetes bacterium]|nr:SDR family oxidoreductase [Armatimonadota bacterium]